MILVELKVHFSLLMRFSPAELLVRCPGNLHFPSRVYSVSSVLGRSKLLHMARKGISAQGTFLPFMILNPPTLLQSSPLKI